MYLGLVLREARKEARSAKAFFFRDSRHFGLNAVDLTQTKLVNLVRRHMSGCPGRKCRSGSASRRPPQK